MADLLNTEIRSSTASFTTQEKTEADMAQIIRVRSAAGLPCLVAEQAGVLSGYVTAAPFRPGEGYAYTLEHSVFVNASEQRTGVGRALMVALEESCRAIGTQSLVAGISAENETALAFHSSLSFAEVGRVRRAGCKFGRWIDLVLLQKHLSTPSDRG